jgi:hypothetical protein
VKDLLANKGISGELEIIKNEQNHKWRGYREIYKSPKDKMAGTC